MHLGKETEPTVNSPGVSSGPAEIGAMKKTLCTLALSFIALAGVVGAAPTRDWLAKAVTSPLPSSPAGMNLYGQKSNVQGAILEFLSTKTRTGTRKYCRLYLCGNAIDPGPPPIAYAPYFQIEFRLAELSDVEKAPPTSELEVTALVRRMVEDNEMKATEEQLDLIEWHMIKKFVHRG